MQKISTLICGTILLASLAGCDDSPAPIVDNSPVPQPQVQQQQPQVIYEQAPQQGQYAEQPQVVYQQAPTGGITAGHLLAAGAGYMAGKHFGGSRGGESYSSRRTTVINKNYYSTPRRSYRSYYGSRGSRSFSSRRSFSRRR